MNRKKLLLGAFIVTIAFGMPAFSQGVALSDLEEIKSAKLVIKDAGKEFDKTHWAYQSLKNISRKYGLLLGDADQKFSGNQPLTRNEAAVILVNLLGKIQQDSVALTEPEETRIQIMKNEFSSELTALTGRVEQVENDVHSLQGSVEKLESSNKKAWSHYYGEDFKIGGLLQMGYTYKPKKGSDTTPANLRVPLSEFRFKGKLHEHIGFLASMNAHRRGSSTSPFVGLLGDVYIDTDIIKNNHIYIGQTRIPVGHEGALSPTSLDTIARAQIGRQFGDFRDTGVKVAGNYKYVDYYLGVYNGASLNTTDANSDVAGGGFIYVKPFADKTNWGDLKLGGGMYQARSNDANTAARYNTDSYGFYGSYKLANCTLKSEYSRKDGYGGAGTQAEGLYFTGLYDLNDKVQLVSRWDTFDSNMSIKSNNVDEYTAGVNYFMSGKALKFQLNGTYVSYESGDLQNSFRVGVLSQYMF